jgi:dipeptidyl aminopeptidase/acylaminoacyl peptidase
MKALQKMGIDSAFFPARFLVLFFILPLVTCPLWGQVVQKKNIKASDYDSLGDLQFHKPSENGMWSCFSMIYKNGSDTLYLKNTFNKKRYFFPLASKPDFLGNNHFIYQDAEGLHILNMNTSRQQTISDVSGYYCSQVFGRIAVLIKSSTTKEQSLVVLDQNGRIMQRIKNITSVKMSPCGNKLLFTVQRDKLSAVGILELGPKIKTTWLIERNSGTIKMLTWEKKAKALSFLLCDTATASKNLLYYYLNSTKLLYCLDPEKNKNFPAEMIIDNKGEYAITISDDLQRIFLGISPKDQRDKNKKIDTGSEVEIWGSNAKHIYPMEQKKRRFEKRSSLALWFPLSGDLKAVSSPEMSKVMLSGNAEYALLSNDEQYQPQFEYDAPRDFYIMNLVTGKKNLFLHNKTVSPAEPLPMSSPAGHFISYIQKDSCWIYNLRTKTYINISDKINATSSTSTDQSLSRLSLTPAGWTADDKEIVLQDQYDIWIAAADGSYSKRLTRGREKQIQFRIYEGANLSPMEKSYDGWINKTIVLSDGLLLKANGADGKTGFFKWKKNTGEIPIVYDNSYIDKLFTAEKEKVLFYQQQKFEQPPKILARKGKTSTAIFQSCPQQKKYHWGTSALINFQNAKGENSQALLYYPAAYNPEQKYPMIVNIYEKQTQNLHKYYNPSLENEAGFNPVVMTSQGYFVLCPDINSQMQNEGPSALSATVCAVQEIISRGLIYPDKIGLIGHSFGGYESSYIITQTSMFTAAVSGAAITDINSYYYTVDWDTGRPTMNYFITGQLKMIQPPSEIPEIYARNSPIAHVGNVTTPLLSYAGKKDNHVDWHQTVAFYMALRRLGKKNIMLLYPNEGHTIINPVNQRDLTQKISQWFAYYLKGELPQPWIKYE